MKSIVTRLIFIFGLALGSAPCSGETTIGLLTLLDDSVLLLDVRHKKLKNIQFHKISNLQFDSLFLSYIDFITKDIPNLKLLKIETDSDSFNVRVFDNGEENYNLDYRDRKIFKDISSKAGLQGIVVVYPVIYRKQHSNNTGVETLNASSILYYENGNVRYETTLVLLFYSAEYDAI